MFFSIFIIYISPFHFVWFQTLEGFFLRARINGVLVAIDRACPRLRHLSLPPHAHPPKRPLHWGWRLRWYYFWLFILLFSLIFWVYFLVCWGAWICCQCWMMEVRPRRTATFMWVTLKDCLIFLISCLVLRNVVISGCWFDVDTEEGETGAEW